MSLFVNVAILVVPEKRWQTITFQKGIWKKGSSSQDGDAKAETSPLEEALAVPDSGT